MYNPKKFRRFIHLVTVTGVLFLLLLMGFQAVPVAGCDETLYVEQASLQVIRSQVLARAALVLEYRSDVEKAQAMSDMQVTLPLFEQEQSFLLTSRALDVQLLLQSARSDYLALIDAVQTILTHANSPVDPVQVNIVLAHNMLYSHTMGQLLTLLLRQASDQVWQLFIIEIIIEFILLAITGVFLVVINRTLIKMVQNYHAGEPRKGSSA